jgi:hypothetical protein
VGISVVAWALAAAWAAAERAVQAQGPLERLQTRAEAFVWERPGPGGQPEAVGTVRLTRYIGEAGGDWIEADTRRRDLGVRWHQVERLSGVDPWFLWRELAAGGSRTLRAEWAAGRLEWVEWSFGTRRAEGLTVEGGLTLGVAPIGELGLLEHTRSSVVASVRQVYLPTSTRVERLVGRVLGPPAGRRGLRWVVWSDAAGDPRAWQVFAGPELMAFGGAPGGGRARRIPWPDYMELTEEAESGP